MYIESFKNRQLIPLPLTGTLAPNNNISYQRIYWSSCACWLVVVLSGPRENPECFYWNLPVITRQWPKGLNEIRQAQSGMPTSRYSEVHLVLWRYANISVLWGTSGTLKLLRERFSSTVRQLFWHVWSEDEGVSRVWEREGLIYSLRSCFIGCTFWITEISEMLVKGITGQQPSWSNTAQHGADEFYSQKPRAYWMSGLMSLQLFLFMPWWNVV